MYNTDVKILRELDLKGFTITTFRNKEKLIDREMCIYRLQKIGKLLPK